MLINKVNIGYSTCDRPFDILYTEAAKESAEYIKKFLNDAIVSENGWWDIALNNIVRNKLCLEFGVYKGESINYFSNKKKDITWYGFDSFYGLQEDWKGGFFAKNHFSLEGKKPEVNENVILINGWFKNRRGARTLQFTVAFSNRRR